MELSSGLMFQLTFLLLICCHLNWAEESQPLADHIQRAIDVNNLGIQDFDNSYGVHLGGRFGYGIPFRPVRRIGSEFLGKRSLETSDPGDSEESFSMSKRARARMGSEFLGKRRLGSEFLGKRSQYQPPLNDDLEGNFPFWELDSSSEFASPYFKYSLSPSGNGPRRAPEMSKRARMGSEFLGKRRASGFADWTWKRARLGSEFLGKRDGGASLH